MGTPARDLPPIRRAGVRGGAGSGFGIDRKGSALVTGLDKNRLFMKSLRPSSRRFAAGNRGGFPGRTGVALFPGPDGRRASAREGGDDLGLLNEGFCWREPETGVFLSRDPAGFADGPDLYAYVRQNPWTMFDPLGLESESEKYWKAEGKRSDVGAAYKMYAGFRLVGAALNPFSGESSLKDANRKPGEGVAQAADEINKSPIPAPLKGVAKFGLGVGGRQNPSPYKRQGRSAVFGWQSRRNSTLFERIYK